MSTDSTTAPAERTFGTRTVDPMADPDLAPVEELSDLDELRAELNAEVADTTVVDVPGRPGWQATFTTAITGEQLDTWRKRSKDRKRADGLDGVKFAALLLASTNVGILRKGKPVELDGEAATVRHPEFLELLAASGAVDGIRKLYGLDGHVDAAARAVMTAAGWGDELGEGTDPTD